MSLLRWLPAWLLLGVSLLLLGPATLVTAGEPAEQAGEETTETEAPAESAPDDEASAEDEVAEDNAAEDEADAEADDAATERTAQEALDAAIDAKIGATTLEQLGEVIELAEEALAKGLDEGNTDFAQQLLSSTLVQRGGSLAQALLGEGVRDPRVLQQLPQLRMVAAGDLRRAIELGEDSVEVNYLLGRLEGLPGGNREQGIQSLTEALEKLEDHEDGDNPRLRALIFTARAQLQAEPEDRVADFDAALELQPELVEALRGRGEAYLRQNKVEESLASFRAALELEPGHAPTLEAIGVGLAANGDLEGALDHLNQALEIEPRMPTAYVHRGRVQQAQGKHQEAINDYDKLLLLIPNNIEVLLRRALSYQQLGNVPKAMADIDRVLQQQPDFPAALRMKAALLAADGKVDEAIAGLEKLLEQQPDDLELLFQTALMRRGMGEVDEAIELYSRIIEENPEVAAVWQGRADAYLALGKQSEAASDYEQALKLEPDSPTVLNNLAWLLSTSPNDELRNGDRAVELATQAAELTDYKAAFILSTLAAAYAEDGDFEKAIEWANKAIEISSPEMKESIAKEREAYEQEEPFREVQTPEDLRLFEAPVVPDANEADATEVETP